MLHTIPPDKAGPQTHDMARAVEACVHCGFCLPTCPTYQVLGEEMNSPRGRIFLMKEALEERIPVADTKPYIDRCLGCLACATACPSGVAYGELLTPFRAWAASEQPRSMMERLRRRILLVTLPHPARFRWAIVAGKFARPFRRWAPEALRPMFDLLPRRLPRAEPLAEVIPAKGKRRGRVALLAGCAQQVLAPEINRATCDVLTANGVEVLIPKAQACCGALAMHIGEMSSARATARRNLHAFPQDVDAIISNAAGCGSGLREYGLLFKGEPEERDAAAFSARVTDVSVYLDRLGLIPPPACAQKIKVAYHDACHLAHAQDVRAAPRRLLAGIPNVELVEPAEWEICCGSAGTYNLEQPDVAATLGQRKAQNLIATGADVVATGNIGCLTQIASHLKRAPREIPILHTIDLLARAYRGELRKA